MRLRVRRMGGIAGVTLRSHVDTAEMSGEETVRVERAVRDHAGHVPAAPPRPDSFRYEITPLDEQGLEPIVLDEQEVPAELRGLVESVRSSGEIERA